MDNLHYDYDREHGVLYLWWDRRASEGQTMLIVRLESDDRVGGITVLGPPHPLLTYQKRHLGRKK